MAQGTITVFDEAALSTHDGRIDLKTDTLKVALVSVIPTAADAVPTWGTGGTTNESTNEVTAGGGYTAGGITLTSQTLTLSGAVAALKASNITWTSSGSGDPSNIKAAVLYSDTATNKDCIAYMDCTPDGSTPISLLSGNISLNWNSTGIVTETAN